MVDTSSKAPSGPSGQSTGERTSWIGAEARALGFDLCGVASADALGSGSARLREWLASGYAGEMKYLHDARRADPRHVLEGARSAVVLGLNYNTPLPRSTEAMAHRSDESPRGWISRYGWGDDYHDTLLEKLETLLAAMRREIREPFEARAYVDTGPVLERVTARLAGFGWPAKNTCLINQKLGSWLFLGVILTTLELEPSVSAAKKLPRDLCGTCTRCLDACPTDAFPEPYVLDARRCISYLTIELRGAIPEELRPQMGAHVFGCDICQDVCPWNRKAPTTELAAFLPREFGASGGDAAANGSDHTQPAHSLFAPELEWLAGLTQEEFSAAFRGSPVKRTKWRGLVRNACIALGNASLARDSAARARVVALLERLAASGDTLIAEHARWALARLESR